MKPVGRERDKEIAILKGDFAPCQIVLDRIHGLNYKIGIASLKPVPDWSTSWNDAKELIQNFNDEGYVCIIRFVRQEYGRDYVAGLKVFKPIKAGDTLYPIGKNQLFACGKTIDEAMADAVSQAWIKLERTKR